MRIARFEAIVELPATVLPCENASVGREIGGG